MTQIKNIDGEILYEGEGSLKEVLEQAVKEKAKLKGANLEDDCSVV